MLFDRLVNTFSSSVAKFQDVQQVWCLLPPSPPPLTVCMYDYTCLLLAEDISSRERIV